MAQAHKSPVPSHPGKTEFYTFAANIFGSQLWNLLFVTLLASGNLRWVLEFSKINVPLFFSICNHQNISVL
jgi:hypothetical protein